MDRTSEIVHDAGVFPESLRSVDGNHTVSWVDIPSGELWVRNAASGYIGRHTLGVAPVGAVLPVTDGWLAAGQGALWHWNSAKGLTPVASFHSACSGVSLTSNDAGIDPWGRVYLGRMALDERAGFGSLVCIEDGFVREICRGLDLPNGLAWSSDNKRMFFAESASQLIYSIPTSKRGERWGERTVFVKLDDGLPDGMCSDSGDGLWVCAYGSGVVHRFDMSGRLTMSKIFPLPNVTSCLVSGRLLYVTIVDEAGIRDDERVHGSLWAAPLH